MGKVVMPLTERDDELGIEIGAIAEFASDVVVMVLRLWTESTGR